MRGASLQKTSYPVHQATRFRVQVGGQIGAVGCSVENVRELASWNVEAGPRSVRRLLDHFITHPNLPNE
jgi:hypothetical protein